MENSRTMENNSLEWDEVPEGWAVCFSEVCPLRETCLRWQAGMVVPDEFTVGRCVTPKALKNGECQCFASTEKVQMARGFSTIYAKVLKDDFTPLRKQMTEMLSGKRYYYEYKRGDRPLSPLQQEKIRQLFERYGYHDSVHFDSLEEAYVFPWV